MTTAQFGDGIRLDCIRQCNPVDLVNYKICKSVIAMQSTPVISKPDITKYPLIAKCDIPPRVLNALFSSAYNEYTVISKEYTGPLDFDITGVDCI